MLFKDKVLLITGGTGSFGKAVLDRFINTDIKEIRILSRDEKKQDDMRKVYASNKVKFYIGDVRDYASIEGAFIGVDYVFHAAALKQVPSCEFFPLEAVKTNILGSDNVISAAVKNGVKKAIFLSTDKAAYPINAMGMSKALMEKNVVARARALRINDTVLCITRYGNVMGSRGSVIPLFLSQIAEGKPLTITNPAMTRFMMSITEAVDLVLYAFKHGKQGDLFVKKAAAVTIGDLGSALLSLHGSTTKPTYIGTRHGEKIYEVLVTAEEMIRAKDLGDFFLIPSDDRDLNYDKYFVEGSDEVSKTKAYSSHNAKKLDVQQMSALLQSILKEGGHE